MPDGRRMSPAPTKVSIAANLEYQLDGPADVLLAIEAIPMADQHLERDLLTVRGSGPLTAVEGMDGLGRRTWLHAEGLISINYTATATITRDPTALAGIDLVANSALPPAYIPYLMPSRYCPSDRFQHFVASRFEAADKGQQVLNLAAWVYENLDYAPGSSDGATTAADTFVSRQGVCRDYAHLLITLCRAADIPARMVSAYALDLDPPDFHAVAEVYLAGAWHLVDPTRLVPETNLVRIAVGRDATDIGFMTIFGTAQMRSQSVTVTRA
jgi:transglutaminase-like putative cysteine protease